MSEVVRESCAGCGFDIWMSKDTNRFLRSSGQSFYCLSGHSNVFSAADSPADILRRERDRLKQQLAQKDDEIRSARATAAQQRDQAEHERRRANGYKGYAAKITKRAKAGVCPCCNRHFAALQRHMATKHPTFTPLDGGGDGAS